MQSNSIMEKKGMRNGVDADALFETMDAIGEKPEIATFRFRARNEWVDGGHCRATAKDFYGACQEDTSRTEPFVFDMDEPPCLLGHNRGANPVEMLLVALSGCMTTSLVLHAAARGWQIDSVESRFEGDLDLRGLLGMDANVRNGYREIQVSFDIQGDLTDEQKEKLVQIARERSPVFDMVTNRVPVAVRLAGE